MLKVIADSSKWKDSWGTSDPQRLSLKSSITFTGQSTGQNEATCCKDERRGWRAEGGLTNNNNAAGSIKDASLTPTQPLIPLYSDLWSLQFLVYLRLLGLWSWMSGNRVLLNRPCRERLGTFDAGGKRFFAVSHVNNSASYLNFPRLCVPDSSFVTLPNASPSVLVAPLCLLWLATDTVTYSLWPGCSPAVLRMNYDVLDQS